MSWINKHVNTNLIESYNNKYGTSEYWHYQNIMFKHNDILKAFNKFVKTTNTPNKILDIGINTALEIEILKNISKKWDWNSIKLTGIDLSYNALNIANKRLKKLNIDSRLINIDVIDYQSPLDFFDACIAITSLQSASIYNKNFNLYFQNIINSMQKSSSFLIVVPNCSFENGELINGGVFDVNKNKQDKYFADSFIGKTIDILSKNKYKHQIIGNSFKTIIANR